VKIDCRLKVEKIIGINDTRHYINEPYLDVVNKCLVATDGHKLVCLPVTVRPEDTSGAVPIEAFKDARRRNMTDAEIVCNGDVTLSHPDGEESVARYGRPDSTGFPDYQSVMPNPDEKPTAQIAINARYLLEVANALTVTGGRGSNKKEPVIQIDIYGERDAVRIRAVADISKSKRAEGAVMPVRYGNC